MIKGLLILAAASGLGFFAYKTVQIFLLRRKFRHLPGPVSKGILGFYMGNMDIVLKYLNQGKILSDLMLDLTKIHGPVFKFQIFDMVVVFTTSQGGVKEAYVTQNFPKIPEVYKNVGFPYSERFLGNGLITDTNQERWKKKRELFNHGFHKQLLLTFLNEFNSKLDIMMEKLRGLADGNTEVVMFSEINHVLLDIIASVGFGMHVDSVNDPKNELNQSVYESLKGFYRYTYDPFIEYKPNEWRFLYNYKRTLRKLRALARKHVLKQLLSIQQGQYMSEDIFGNLLKNYKSKHLDVEDMVDNFLTFFVAGQETTANTLAFAILELGRNPDVLKKVRNELDQSIGSKAFITFDDLTQLSYTSCVYKEVLRLWPPIPEIARLVDKEMQLNGYEIPKGAWLQVSTYVSGRCSEYFENPEEFMPERFMTGSFKPKINNYTYFPFSLGARNCIGQNFAKIVGKMFLAKFVKDFDFMLDKEQNFGYIQEGTLRPFDGAKCFLRQRND